MVKARNIILECLAGEINAILFQTEHNQLRITFHDDTVLYIGYNDAEEYAYQLMFSKEHLDRIRFDCMDKKWDVSSDPHHFHPRFHLQGLVSPMNGDPTTDIPLLVNLIQKGDLKKKKSVLKNKY